MTMSALLYAPVLFATCLLTVQSSEASVPPEYNFIEVRGNKRCRVDINARSFLDLFNGSERLLVNPNDKAEKRRIQDQVADGIVNAFLFFARKDKCDYVFIPTFNVSRVAPERHAVLENRNVLLRKANLFGAIFRNLKRHKNKGVEDFYRPPMYNEESLDFVRDGEPFYRVMFYGRRKLIMKVQGTSPAFEVSPYWDKRELYSKDILMWISSILIAALNISLTSGLTAQSVVFLAWYSVAALVAQYLYGPISHGNLATDFQSES